jgi:hypothetical protein
MKAIYRVCCFNELVELISTGFLCHNIKPSFGLSFTKNLKCAEQYYRSGKRFKVFDEVKSNWLVTFDLSKFNNYTEIQYDLGWFIQHPKEANHVFSGEIDLKKCSENILYNLKESIETVYSTEEEILVNVLSMEEGLILSIKTNNPLLETLKEISKEYSINFIKDE